MLITDTTIPHDPTRGDLCPCARCEAQRELRLAESRHTSATQLAAWRPRSRKRAAELVNARAARDAAAEQARQFT
jgi:hypothetical protein